MDGHVTHCSLQSHRMERPQGVGDGLTSLSLAWNLSFLKNSSSLDLTTMQGHGLYSLAQRKDGSTISQVQSGRRAQANDCALALALVSGLYTV